MALTINRNMSRWIIIVASFIIISLILWNTYAFFQNFKAEERSKMQIWSSAQTEFLNSEDNPNLDLILQILNSNNSNPVLVVIEETGTVGSTNNIDESKLKDSIAVQRLITKFRNENNPIDVVINDEVYSTIYYGNSPLLNKLKYYPLALVLIIFLFAAVAYFFYKSSKTAEQNKLWTGMAKETAHQIGTPLSSLVGWTEILRSENVKSEYLIEIEKDISRLQTITDRFSKIGSVPTLEETDIVSETSDSYEYLKSRSSKLIQFEIETPERPLLVNLNKQLYSWTIENLVKNAIDAMKGKGALKISISSDDKLVKINISDTGKGISKQNFNSIFQPGFTTKQRGWGLGLSLAKRIIEDYHNGRIKVLSSELGKGTTMQISLKLVS
ncbi:HAMP domain-containing sensor histidine kinase [Psychroserpens sp.]|uniref:sensor histidine kinase n=1 Tax=Psychroserpens sp. TaxID=2020870 RepID=UPI001B04380B|nr:HAMP domain-containing sensor histidine kinase [Psychroserpens sp.]MBO6605618.1 HAMP domain-containing histidine kinase [Psychroserpens sp.]MBO6632573.1 HAMP domain-containing histidine kinase [Psychroserpens sp.]MBO6653573.1 HAMP domain-containing histidine kinase [Psychroserpens sp.]MBO6681894.1 HAMP domain-containing histidine kinase [Psychroserpens sp.]MBO6748992.1 HAMP domain-containing histidine kinase [Psychroserpens sp.]